MLELLPISPLLLEAARDEGWTDDTDTNRDMGFGSEPEDIGRATAAFLEVTRNGAVGIYVDSHPAGWVSVQPDGNWGAQLGVFIAPKMRQQGFGREAVLKMADELLDRGYRRVGARVPECNSGAREFFRRCGFKREGKTWECMEIDGQWYDTENLVLTKRVKKGQDHGSEEN